MFPRWQSHSHKKRVKLMRWQMIYWDNVLIFKPFGMDLRRLGFRYTQVVRHHHR